MPDPVRLLYIDDDLGLGRLLRRALAPLGVDVRHATSSDTGLALLAAEPFDVVALDHDLGGETGLDLLPRLAAAGAPPIVYVTGSDDARVAVAALKAGAVDYVWKDVEGHYRELLGEVIAGALLQERLRAEREEAQRQIAEAKERAEVLLKEVNHRVANSLALVASVARMQARAIEDETARLALAEMQARITAISGIHRSLYTSPDVRHVQLDAYLRSLAGELAAAMEPDAARRPIEVDAEPGIQVATDKAVSLGVIVAELVTNAYKYAYPDGAAGRIGVSLKRSGEDRLLLIVEDDGVGSRPSDAARGSGIGTRIVRAMATSLGSTVVNEASRTGTKITVKFVA